MIEIKSLHKSFGKLQVLKDINLEFPSSGITALLGPNGSGKTTLLKCFLGLNTIEKGDISFNSKSIRGTHDYRHQISHVPQIANFPGNLNSRELIKMIKQLRSGPTREKRLIELFNLEGELHKKMANLSGGNRQKINLVLALMFDCPLLLLDEPTAGLDPVAIIHLKDFLQEEKKRGKLILLTTHIISLVEELADHILFLLDGEIYFNGMTQELMKNAGEHSLERAIAKILGGHPTLSKITIA